MSTIETARSPRLYHGTKAELAPGELIVPGHASNYGARQPARYVYLTATLEAATWGGPNSPSARGAGESTRSSRPGRMKTTRT